VVDGIIEETNAKTRPPVQSVYDLAMLITNRCSGMFDRHRLDVQDYQFLDMFESSIGHVTNRETQLFSRFNVASSLSGKWLRQNRQQQEGTHIISKLRKSQITDPIFSDVLLDIGIETALLAEIKDIRDELNIITVVLANQTNVLDEFEGHMIEELRSEGVNRRSTDNIVHEIRKRSREQRRLLDQHRKDVDRMDKQAEGIYTSLTHLLDLKQKHSNALEARFARDQAVIAAKQGQTIMVFTIVTIIFLPMSFVAAFFAINVEEWQGTLTIPYVSKYLFGIGLGISIPLIAMAFTVTDIFDALSGTSHALKSWLARRRTQKRQERLAAAAGGGDNDDGDDSSLDDDTAQGVLKAKGGARSKSRLSYTDEARQLQLLAAAEDLESPRSVRSRLSVRLSGARKYSVGSGSGFPFPRPSFDRTRIRISEDLERGKEAASMRAR
jgi:Mg2+ and Co2+ transporter CorA